MKGLIKMRDTTRKIILICSVFAILAFSGMSVFAKVNSGRGMMDKVRDKVENGINEIFPRTTDTTSPAGGTTPDTTLATTPETTTAPAQSGSVTTTKAPDVTSTNETTTAAVTTTEAKSTEEEVRAMEMVEKLYSLYAVEGGIRDRAYINYK